jgi:hypothetical protein
MWIPQREVGEDVGCSEYRTNRSSVTYHNRSSRRDKRIETSEV